MKDKNKGDYHLFTTNHPYFIELGLGSFTLSTLIDWWNQQDHQGRYLNRRHINLIATPLDTLAVPTNNLNKLLGITPTTEFYWYGWKPNLQIENAGRFKKQNLYGMNGHNGGSVNDQWIYQGYTSHNMNDINSTISKVGLASNAPIIAITLSNQAVQPYYIKPANYYTPLITSLNPIYSLIQLNKYMALFDDYYPYETWDKNDLNTHKPLTSAQAFGSWALVNEIRAAKGNPCIEWSGNVTFYVSQNNGLLNQCELTENVTFKLYLTDESMMSVDNKAVTVKNLTIVGPKRDVFGPAVELDGERASVSEQDVSNHTAGELELQWNPISKKYQSGNVNMLAKLVTDVGPGKAPSLEYLLNNDIKETLEDADNAHSYIPARGSGMPIRAQNSMPLQWSPNYLEEKNTRCSTNNKKKLIVPVYNFNPRKAYPSGQEVLITYIDNMWHISDLGEGDTDLGTVVKTEIGKWGSFTYLTTSSEFFFKGQVVGGESVNITPRSAELNFHKLFYFKCNDTEDITNNLNIDYGIAGGYNVSQPFDTTQHAIWSDVNFNGWLQITSFDFLDSQIYGIRSKAGPNGNVNSDKCSISSTSATLNAAGNIIPFNNAEYPYRNSAHTGTFFGCVFPNGYNGTSVYDDPNRTNTWKVNSAGITISPANYFQIPSNDLNPFENNQTRNNSNAKCRATAENGIDAPINPDTEGLSSNSWSRGTTNPDANMFYIGAAGYRRTIPADVMLNASPSGKYGSPIKPIELFSKVNNVAINPKSTDIYDLVNGGCWLYKLTPQAPNTYNSAFDFEPVKKDNLMFRPLKLEAYLQFGSFMTSTGSVSNSASNLDLLHCKKEIDGFYAEAARTQMDYTWPVSYYVQEREYNNCKDNIIREGNAAPSKGAPLKWGAWVKNKPIYNKLHRNNYWSDITSANLPGSLEWTVSNTNIAKYNAPNGNWKGAGAFGIITTSNKVKANSRIEFVTKNLYGMSAAAHGTFSVQGGHQYQDQTWGVGNAMETYKQENIIDLSVRIYQGHPQHLTVYDPRYFAVHHFNEGVDFLYDQYEGIGPIPINALGYDSRNALREEFKNIRGANGALLSSVYYDYTLASGVDIKVPSRYEKHLDYTQTTLHTEGSIYKPQQLSAGEFVLSDATINGTTINPPLMAEKYWRLNTRRTGKLLPYRYSLITLGIPVDKGDIVTLMPKSSNATKTVSNLYQNLIVENYGTNYTIGSYIGRSEYGILLEVTATGQGGSIAGLTVINTGSGIPLSFVQGTGTKISDVSSTFTMNTLTGNGSDFTGYFLSSKTHLTIACDPKPFLIKDDNGNEIVRIADPKVGPSHQTTGFTAVAEGSSYVDSTHTTAFNIPEALRSKDSSYDVFFHFHNDISFTWLACGSNSNGQPHGDAFNASECTEQHVTIEQINLI